MKRVKISASTIPTEAEEQENVISWAELAIVQYPELKLLHHIPNGGSRDVREAVNLKRQGVKSGVPDLCLPVPRGKYHGLYIELKRIKGGRVSDEQQQWLTELQNVGYRAVVCKGWEAAKTEIEWYLNLK